MSNDLILTSLNIINVIRTDVLHVTNHTYIDYLLLMTPIFYG
jgi:hypothetical protein